MGDVPLICLSYLTCSTPRSGSNFLCEVMRATGVAGHPDDYFWNPPYWHERWRVSDFPSYLRRILREGTSPNGVFGCKMMWGYLAELVPQLAELFGVPASDPAAVLGATFPNLRYVWLTRRDKVRQGISFYRALETRIWRSTDVAAVPPANPPFNFPAIDRLVQLSTWEDDAWQEFFRKNGIAPLVVAYEDLAQDPEGIAERILTYLGLPGLPLPEGPWQHQKQADTLTEEWVAKYGAEKRGV
jgi:trehalose 2-sulfotransferase